MFLVFISSATAQDSKKQIIYQIVTNRFLKGSTSNDNPSQSSAGDQAKIQQHMSYIKGTGVTAICKIASDGTITWEGGSNHTYHRSIQRYGVRKRNLAKLAERI